MSHVTHQRLITQTMHIWDEDMEEMVGLWRSRRGLDVQVACRTYSARSPRARVNRCRVAIIQRLNLDNIGSIASVEVTCTKAVEGVLK
jgi:hypothetical protein